MKKVLVAALLFVPLLGMAAEATTCLDVTSVMKYKYHLSMEDVYQVKKACETGVKMKSDGISETRFAGFLQKYVTDADMPVALKRATEESLVAGYDGNASE